MAQSNKQHFRKLYLKSWIQVTYQPHQMVKHIQTIRRLLPANSLSVFDHFVGLDFRMFCNLNLSCPGFIDPQSNYFGANLFSLPTMLIIIKYNHVNNFEYFWENNSNLKHAKNLKF